MRAVRVFRSGNIAGRRTAEISREKRNKEQIEQADADVWLLLISAFVCRLSVCCSRSVSILSSFCMSAPRIYVI
jgi:hypothetical protein